MEYITTKEQLKEVSLANLGPMVKGKYAEFLDRARRIEVKKPKLVIETVLKSPSYYGVTDIIYAIAEFEWDEFAVDELASYTPIVHVVDGEKYTTGI